ncbi:pathogenesis-related protein 1-like isoform X2 [Zingiber officinale]|nr:pathogenesis-related protein 1-like [Zingiber officinale]XP_042463722.1 pathogenesis-related protein 1-like isoform X2 [Zingiber officinale]
MVSGSFTGEVTLNVSAARLWKGGIEEPHILYPKLMPDYISKAERIGEGVGAINVFYYSPAANLPPGSLIKNKIEVLDEATFTFKNSSVEGGLLGVLVNSFTYESVFIPSGPDSCVAKIKFDYETIADQDLSEEELKAGRDGSIAVLKATEGYLLANPDVYA